MTHLPGRLQSPLQHSCNLRLSTAINVRPRGSRGVIVAVAAAERVPVESDQPVYPAHTANRSSWLCRDDADRERMLDMEARVRPWRQRALAILAVAIVAVGPWLGWWPLLFLFPAAAFFAAADHFLTRVARPELVMFAAWIGSEVTIAGAVWLEGRPGVVALSWLAI